MKKLHSVVILAVLVVAGCAGSEETADSPPVVAVKVARVQTMDLRIEVHAPATVYPREQASLASRLTARIRELRVQKGDRVRAGEVLAQLEDQDLAAQRAEAAAALTDAEATLAKMSAGTLPGDIERARGQVTATKAALDLAQSNYDRRSELYEQGAIPRRDFITSQTELAQAKASADVAQTELRLLESQSSGRDIEIAQSRRDQAKSRLDLLDTQLGFAQIRSPFNGTITDQFMFPGDMAKPDAPMFTVANLSTAVARAQVPEADAAQVRTGQSCSLVPADMPKDSFDGHVTVVNAAIDPQKRTVEVWCEIPNSSMNLRAGVFGTLAITTGTEANALVVPQTAVQFEEGSLNGVVMIAGSDKKAQRREVTTGPAVGDLVPIRSGLTGGEMIIVEGGYGLPEGTSVEWTGDSQ